MKIIDIEPKHFDMLILKREKNLKINLKVARIEINLTQKLLFLNLI
jgi:hypothetical protein